MSEDTLESLRAERDELNRQVNELLKSRNEAIAAIGTAVDERVLELEAKLQKQGHSSADVSDARIKIKADTYGLQAPAFTAGAIWMRERLKEK